MPFPGQMYTPPGGAAWGQPAPQMPTPQLMGGGATGQLQFQGGPGPQYPKRRRPILGGGGYAPPTWRQSTFGPPAGYPGAATYPTVGRYTQPFVATPGMGADALAGQRRIQQY